MSHDHTPKPILPTRENSRANSPAWLRFALYCALFLLLAIWQEPRLTRLCSITAAQVGWLLNFAGVPSLVRDNLVQMPGFSVRIVTECTPLYPCLLFSAFVLAQPSSPKRTLTGLIMGFLLLSAANLLRITCLTAAGSSVSGLTFQILHVYLGQIVMLVLVMAAALFWSGWNKEEEAPLPFLLGTMFWGSFFYIPWVIVNRAYVALLDNVVASVFALLYPGYALLTPRPFPIYNHTFAIPFFLALCLADRSPWNMRKQLIIVSGILSISCWHTLFRISHVAWTALGIVEMAQLHQLIYLIGQFLLPFMLWLLLAARGTNDDPDNQYQVTETTSDQS